MGNTPSGLAPSYSPRSSIITPPPTPRYRDNDDLIRIEREEGIFAAAEEERELLPPPPSSSVVQLVWEEEEREEKEESFLNFYIEKKRDNLNPTRLAPTDEEWEYITGIFISLLRDAKIESPHMKESLYFLKLTPRQKYISPSERHVEIEKYKKILKEINKYLGLLSTYGMDFRNILLVLYDRTFFVKLSKAFRKLENEKYISLQENHIFFLPSSHKKLSYKTINSLVTILECVGQPNQASQLLIRHFDPSSLKIQERKNVSQRIKIFIKNTFTFLFLFPSKPPLIEFSDLFDHVRHLKLIHKDGKREPEFYMMVLLCLCFGN